MKNKIIFITKYITLIFIIFILSPSSTIQANNEIVYQEITETELNDFLNEFYLLLSEKNNLKLKSMVDKPINPDDFKSEVNLVDFEIIEKKKTKKGYLISTKIYLDNNKELFQYFFIYKSNDKILMSFDKFYEEVIQVKNFLPEEQYIFTMIFYAKTTQWSKIDLLKNNKKFKHLYTDKEISEMLKSDEGIKTLKENPFYYQLYILYSNYYYGKTKVNIDYKNPLNMTNETALFKIFMGNHAKYLDVETLNNKIIKNHFFSKKILPDTYEGLTVLEDKKDSHYYLPYYGEEKETSKDFSNTVVILFILTIIMLPICVFFLLRLEENPNELYEYEEDDFSISNDVTNIKESVTDILKENTKDDESNKEKFILDESEDNEDKKIELNDERKIIYDEEIINKDTKVDIKTKRKIDFD